MSPGVFHKLVQCGPSGSRSTEAVIYVLLHDLEPTLAGELPKLLQLVLGMLI